MAELRPFDLDDWQTISLAEIGIRDVAADQFRKAIVNGGRDPVYRVETGTAGAHVTNVIPYDVNYEENCSVYSVDYLTRRSATWEAEYLYLINQPCYVVTGSGVVVLHTGEVISDTLFPTGWRNAEGSVGGGIRAANFADEMRKAHEIREGTWAPLFSYGSSVYGHMLAESLVQDSAFYRANISPLISYIATAWPVGAQKLALEQAHSPITQFPCNIVKVPRVVFASKLYRHLPLGTEFREFASGKRTYSRAQSTGPGPYGTKIYLSRIGVSGRRLTNEAELAGKLSGLGFHILSAQNLSFEDQVRAFRDARVIAGPYGSGLINAAFAAPGASFCELRSINNPDHSPNWDDFYLALAGTMDFTYGVHVSDNSEHADEWECDIPDVVRLIQTMSDAIDEGNEMLVDDVSSLTSATPTQSAPSTVEGYWEVSDHTGIDCYSLAVSLHHRLKPGNYLEIGSQSDETLAIARCASISVAPTLEITQAALAGKPACMMFRMTSDQFFAKYDPKLLLAGDIDMAFINGSRRFEHILRDFSNIERHGKRNTVVLLQDCVPVDAHVGRRAMDNRRFSTRSRHPHWWSGDGWKAIVALKKLRPDLHIVAMNGSPSGLAIITNLDPASDNIMRNYFNIVLEMKDIDLGDYGPKKFMDELKIYDTEQLSQIIEGLWF